MSHPVLKPLKLLTRLLLCRFKAFKMIALTLKRLKRQAKRSRAKTCSKAQRQQQSLIQAATWPMLSQWKPLRTSKLWISKLCSTISTKSRSSRCLATIVKFSSRRPSQTPKSEWISILAANLKRLEALVNCQNDQLSPWSRRRKLQSWRTLRSLLTLCQDSKRGKEESVQEKLKLWSPTRRLNGKNFH